VDIANMAPRQWPAYTGRDSVVLVVRGTCEVHVWRRLTYVQTLFGVRC
jgi:hypothetical protein